MHLVCIQVNHLHNVLTLEIAPIEKKKCSFPHHFYTRHSRHCFWSCLGVGHNSLEEISISRQVGPCAVLLFTASFFKCILLHSSLTWHCLLFLVLVVSWSLVVLDCIDGICETWSLWFWSPAASWPRPRTIKKKRDPLPNTSRLTIDSCAVEK